MQVVPLGLKSIKRSEINFYKNNWKDVQHKVNNQREETKIDDKKS